MYKIDSTVRRSFDKFTGKKLQNRKINNLKDIQQALHDVYDSPYIIARRMKGRGIIKSDIDQFLNQNLATKIHDFFTKKPPNTQLNKQNFDIFFYDLCNRFTNFYNKKITGIGKNIEFGIAQKLINMTFKYLSCYADYNNFADLFKFCHMPIDSYILYYLSNNIGNITCIKIKNKRYIICKYKGLSWSSIKQQEYQDLVKDYRNWQKHNYSKVSSLHLEFYIWKLARSGNTNKVSIQRSLSLKNSIKKFYM